MDIQAGHRQSLQQLGVVLKDSQGVFIGDHHGGEVIAAWMKQMLPAMARQQGVRHLYVEIGDVRQLALFEAFNRANTAREKAESSASLREYLRHSDWEATHGTADRNVEVYEVAREAGIAVLPIDVDRRPQHPNESATKQVNRRWAENITQYLMRYPLAEEGRYVVWAGTSHAHPEDGVNHFLGIPSVEVYAPHLNGYYRVSFEEGSEIVASANAVFDYRLIQYVKPQELLREWREVQYLRNLDHFNTISEAVLRLDQLEDVLLSRRGEVSQVVHAGLAVERVLAGLNGATGYSRHGEIRQVREAVHDRLREEGVNLAAIEAACQQMVAAVMPAVGGTSVQEDARMNVAAISVTQCRTPATAHAP